MHGRRTCVRMADDEGQRAKGNAMQRNLTQRQRKPASQPSTILRRSFCHHHLITFTWSATSTCSPSTFQPARSIQLSAPVSRVTRCAPRATFTAPAPTRFTNPRNNQVALTTRLFGDQDVRRPEKCQERYQGLFVSPGQSQKWSVKRLMSTRR